jgi:hypothetical protein
MIKDITFGYGLNLTYMDENHYYGLRKIPLGKV